jgi:hypothetical protein
LEKTVLGGVTRFVGVFKDAALATAQAVFPRMVVVSTAARRRWRGRGCYFWSGPLAKAAQDFGNNIAN